MSTIFIQYTVCTLLSALCSYIIIPLIIRFCKEHNIYDNPNIRKIHKTKIPRLGGASFLPSMFVGALSVTMILSATSKNGTTLEISIWSVMFLVGMCLVYTVGFLDDLSELSANVKFGVQIVAASLFPFAGLYINNMYGLFGIYELPFCIGVPLTIAFVVLINNAMNLIDGIDGLCSGLALIALTGFLILFHERELTYYCFIIAGFIGVILAFFRYNLFGSESKGNKIFMGDSGSLTLGYIIAFLFIKHSAVNENVEINYNSMLEAASLVAVPVMDVLRVFTVRILAHKPVFQPDRNHIHHKLMDAGLSQHQTLMVILLFAMVYIFIGFGLDDILSISAIFIIDFVLWFCFHGILNIAIAKNSKRK